MLRRSLYLCSMAPPVIGSKAMPRGSHMDDNPSVSDHKPWDTKELLMAEFGWHRGQLPKFAATTPFHRQTIARRMATELIRKDYLIVGGARAPALRILADHVVELAKMGDTDSRQHLAHFLHDPLMVDKAFDEYPRRFRDMNGKYCMMTKLKNKRRSDNVQMYFVEYKNREMSDNHKGEDLSQGPERFFLPPRVLETEKGVQRPPHMQMAFDRWASKFKTEEFHHWWRMRHAKMRFWGIRNVPHPSDVDPLWTEKEEEEWHNEMLSSTGDIDEEIDLDATELNVEGEGGSVGKHPPEMPGPGAEGPQNAKRSF
jgi:ribosomal protein L17